MYSNDMDWDFKTWLVKLWDLTCTFDGVKITSKLSQCESTSQHCGVHAKSSEPTTFVARITCACSSDMIPAPMTRSNENFSNGHNIFFSYLYLERDA